ncbi:MAG: T9SS type A sorting domain-containing protein, partial [Reichenbachiella sp.]
RMWKTEAAFIRPKWGIYRSLDDQASLRDEEVLFADISIEEIEEDIVDPPLALKEELAFQIYPNPASDVLIIATEQFVDSLTVKLYNASGSLVLSQTQKSNQLVVGHLDNGLYVMVLSNKSGVISSQHFLKR